MGGEWKEAQLGDFIELKRGYDLPRRERKAGTIPIVSSSGISDYHSVAKVEGPGVVTGRYGTIGKVYYIENDFWPLNTSLYVRDFKGNDKRFVSYFLQTINWLAYSDKAAVPGVNRNHVHQAEVKIPPLPTQRRIANILGTLDDKIGINQRLSATLAAIARAIFKSWFIDFDPVRAKMDGRDTGLPAKVSGLFPDSFEDSELGKIPKGWEVRSFGDFLTYKSERIEDTEAEIYSATNNGLFLREKKFAKRLSKSNSKNKRIEIGDLVFGLSREILNFGVMKEKLGSVSPVYQIFKVDNGVYNAELLEMFMRRNMYEFMDIIKPSAREGQAIDREYLLIKKIAIPEKQLQNHYYSIYLKYMANIEEHERQNETLAGIRNTLLPKLMQGELPI